MRMNWFRRIRQGLQNAERASELAQDVQTIDRASVELAKHVIALRERLEAQEREAAQMATEWATTLDKIGRWASRQSARERRDTDKKLDTLAAGPGENGAPVEARPLTKPEMRARVAQLRMGTNVAHDEGQ